MDNKNKIIINKENIIIYLSKNISYDNFFSNSKNALLSNMDELKNILRNKNNKIINVLYFNKEKVGKMLYDNEEIIEINKDIINKDNISEYFYLSLLIKDNPSLINYVYDIDLIREIKNKLKKENKSFIKQLIISKIGIELINNYKNSDNYDEFENDELTSIEKDFLEIINNNLFIFIKLNLNYTVDDIIKKNIDVIYIEIIIYLLRQTKFENYDDINNILKQLDIEYIKLTKLMFDELNKELEKNEYLLNYQINELNDLIDNKKTNFYYFLIKYILKDPIYIYQMKLLDKARIAIIKIINSKKDYLIKIINEKINYIIENIVDSKYYYLKLYTPKNLNVNENNETTKFKTTIDKVDDEEKGGKNENLTISENYESMRKILNKSSFLFKNDENRNISINILDDDEDEVIKKKNEKYLEKDYNILFKNYEKLLDFLFNIKVEIQKKFSNDYNLLIKIKFNQEEINNNSNSIYNITCIYDFYPLNEETISSFKDENILINGINQGFSFLISKINDHDYSAIKYNKFLDIIKIIKEKEEIKKINKKQGKEEKKEEIPLLDIVSSEEVSDYKIIQFKKIIASHSISTDFLYILSNGYYISGGRQREIYIYDKDFYFKVVNLKHKPLGICEIKYHDNKNILKIIAFSYENSSLISCETHKNNKTSVHTYTISACNILEIERNNYIINNFKSGYISKDFFDKNDYKKIFNYSYNIGIKINEKLSVFTSNSVIANGKDKLIIYDKISNDILFELEGYSFSLSKNSLLLIKNNKSLSKEKAVICACKKYSSYQKNGILLINIRIEDKQDFYDKFYETSNFEPYCFSQILLVNKTYKNSLSNIYDTNYFFVGGFDLEKRIGTIGSRGRGNRFHILGRRIWHSFLSRRRIWKRSPIP